MIWLASIIALFFVGYSVGELRHRAHRAGRLDQARRDHARLMKLRAARLQAARTAAFDDGIQTGIDIATSAEIELSVSRRAIRRHLEVQCQ